MAKPIYGLSRKPGSLQQLSKFTRGWNDDRAQFLMPLAFQDVFYKHYDFDSDIISTDWTVNRASGSSTNFAISTSLENGAIQGATAATDNTTISFNYDGVFFDAVHSPGMLVRMKVDTATSTYFEVGFSDAPTQPYTINWVADTPALQSNGTTDVATVVIDTDQTQKTAMLLAVGTTDVTAAKRNLSAHGFGKDGLAGSVSNYDVPGVSPIAADTYFTVMLQLNSAAAATLGANGVSATINGNPTLTGTVATGLDTAIPLRPYIICGNRAASVRTFTIDYIALWCNRT